MPFAPETLRILKIDRSISGVATRRSFHTNAASSTADRSRPPRVRGSAQPQTGAWLKAKTPAIRPSVTTSAPRESSVRRTLLCACAGTSRGMRMLTTTPIGTLMKKFQRQPAYCVRIPPSSSPTAATIDQ